MMMNSLKSVLHSSGTGAGVDTKVDFLALVMVRSEATVGLAAAPWPALVLLVDELVGD